MGRVRRARPGRPGSRAALGVLAVAALVACQPYTVGSTAQPVPRGSPTRSSSVAVPIQRSYVDRLGRPQLPIQTELLLDNELRFRTGAASDLGLRLTGAAGLVVNGKRRLWGADHVDSAAIAASVGAGLLQLGSDFFAEGTLHVSGPRRRAGLPYAAIKWMDMTPLQSPSSASYTPDAPSLGLILGWRFGDHATAISPEVGIWQDGDDRRFWTGRWIVVPSLNFNGPGLLVRLLCPRCVRGMPDQPAAPAG